MPLRSQYAFQKRPHKASSRLLRARWMTCAGGGSPMRQPGQGGGGVESRHPIIRLFVILAVDEPLDGAARNQVLSPDTGSGQPPARISARMV